jgi:hypothetical protein
MNRRTEERLSELNQAYLGEASRIMSESQANSEPALSIGGHYEPRFINNSSMPDQKQPIEEVEVRNMTLAPYDVTIVQVHNGFIVNVGCKQFVFETFETASRYLTEYFQNPTEMERKFITGELFKK